MRILYFAALRERIGAGEEERSPPPSVATVRDLMHWLSRQSPRHEAAFAAPEAICAAVDRQMASSDASTRRAREVAFFPPVTGG